MRSLLFVPGDDERKIAKALASEADAIILDLEDSVSPGAKARARGVTADALRTRAGASPTLLVRINALESGLAEGDVAAVMPGAPAGIVLPKAAGGPSIAQLANRLAVAEAENGLADGSTTIHAIATETAAALFVMGSYVGASRRLASLSWGAEDLSADLGAETNRDADGGYAPAYCLARALTLVAARAAGVEPVDAVFVDFRNEAGLRAEGEAARREGFTGKMAIHPAQVAVINEVFTPSAEAISRARAVLAAFDAAPEAGVASLDGVMLDRPHRIRAERTLARAGASLRS